MQKPLLEHLIELRQRLMWCVAAFVAVFLCAYAVAEPIFQFLVQPLAHLMEHDASRRLIYTGLTEAFLTYIKVSFFTALFFTSPFILFQVWRFVAPGLYGHEKKVLSPYFIATPLLFLAGAAMAYYVVCPMAWEFFLSFETQNSVLPIQLEARVSEYLSLMIQLVFAFGLCFQLPIVILLLAKLGAVNAEMLTTKRKYAFLFITIGAAIFTPPDIISPLSLIIPLYALYEISIVLVKLGQKKSSIEDMPRA